MLYPDEHINQVHHTEKPLGFSVLALVSHNNKLFSLQLFAHFGLSHTSAPSQISCWKSRRACVSHKDTWHIQEETDNDMQYTKE